MFKKFHTFTLKLLQEKTGKIYTIRSDHGGEFESNKFASFYESQGITHTFSVPRTPQQNRVGERKNCALIELGQTMLQNYLVPTHLWIKAVATACHVLNRTLIREHLNKTSNEI